MPEVSKRLQGDSRDAYNFLIDNLKELKPHTVCKGVDIIENAKDRYDAYINRSTASTPPTISTGFTELDEIFGGWEYGEELVTLVGRTAGGKCVEEGTEVEMANGMLQNIENIKKVIKFVLLAEKLILFFVCIMVLINKAGV